MSAREWVNTMLFGGQHEGIIEHIDRQDEKVRQLTDERDAARRLFNRVEAAITHHRTAKSDFTDEADDALYAARDRVLRDAATPEPFSERAVEREA